MALGALIIKEKLQISDREVVEQIRETPYLQYFIGLDGYKDKEPFYPSVMVHFRKRLDGQLIQKTNEIIFKEYREEELKKTENQVETEENEGVTNKGKLIVDATCTPADIRYPNDMSILNEVRENT